MDMISIYYITNYNSMLTVYISHSVVYKQLYKKKLTQVYSRYPCEKPLIERVFVKSG